MKNNQIIKLKSNSDEKNHNWKGDDVGIHALHKYVRRRLPKPEKCDICKVKPPIDLANISGEYKRDLNDWQWLCRRCHMLSDGRLDTFLLTVFPQKDMSERICSICDSKETQIRKKDGRPMWYFYNKLLNTFVCHYCYMYFMEIESDGS